ncbi:hypothetical protein Q5H92_10940 [Hymenobacter sp. M29]|uniref:Uncharacterized protein n=1 Tax=Hymenobacter mellowenesis TaxID=3063995 RepID=A0ABT9ABZ6_9BACT|nr:hypothetical protein [Hymenobacter sp. M29]MDO7846874.1 hypothetical protein [Hymenobacter sp. M29]
MKKNLYSFVLAALLIFAHSAVQASAGYLPTPDSPNEQRKAATAERRAAAREKMAAAKQVSKMKKLSVKSHRFTAKLERMMLVVLGLEEGKSVTSPRQLRRQLHGHQKQLKKHAKFQSRIRRGNTHD